MLRFEISYSPFSILESIPTTRGMLLGHIVMPGYNNNYMTVMYLQKNIIQAQGRQASKFKGNHPHEHTR